LEHPEFDLTWVGLKIVKSLGQTYQGIEEVTDPDNGEDVIDGNEETRGREIEEAFELSDDATEGGVISLRNAITFTVLSVWVIWNVIGLAQFMQTGNILLLLASPAIMSVPLYRVLGYRFRG